MYKANLQIVASCEIHIAEQFQTIWLRQEVVRSADSIMRSRDFLEAYEQYQALVQPSEEFVEAFPTSTRGLELVVRATST